MKPSSHLIVKLVATLTVLVANIVVSHHQRPDLSRNINSAPTAGLCLCHPPLPTGPAGRGRKSFKIFSTKIFSKYFQNVKYLVAVSCTLLLCLLVLITATLDNVTWWSNLFPSAFMTEEGVTDLLNRLSVAEPGYKVTVQQGEGGSL